MEVAVTAGAVITATETHGHTGEMTMITTAIGEIEVDHTNPYGIGEGEACGAMAPPHRTYNVMTAVGL